MLQKSCHKYYCNIKSFVNNYAFHESHNLNVSNVLELFLFIYEIPSFILFPKIPMYYFSADYSGLFQLKGKSRRTFTIVASTKNFFKFRFWGGVLLPAAGLLRTEVTGKVS